VIEKTLSDTQGLLILSASNPDAYAPPISSPRMMMGELLSADVLS
jgi:hypothetical protein